MKTCSFFFAPEPDVVIHVFISPVAELVKDRDEGLGGAVAPGTPGFASLCVQCGECREKCPRHIDIPAVLESVAEELEGPGFGERVAMAKQLFKET